MKIIKNLFLILGVLIVSLIYSCKKTSTKPTPPPPVLPPANIIGYWPLHNNANDESRYGNNGVAFNVTPTADRFGKANNAFYFDGHSSYIAIPDSVGLRLVNTDFTLNAWIKLDSYNTNFTSAIMSKRISGGNHGWLWAITGNELSPAGKIYFDPGAGAAIGRNVVDTGKWYMVSCVYSASQKTLSTYINGILDFTVNNVASGNPSIASPLFIGKDQLDPGENEYYFNGSLEEIKIYNEALDIPSIQTLYNASN